MLHIYWLYLNPMRAKERDSLMDLTLVFLAEVVRGAFIAKVKNHLLKLHHEPVFVMLCNILY
jgi:hypothetical protein